MDDPHIRRVVVRDESEQDRAVLHGTASRHESEIDRLSDLISGLTAEVQLLRSQSLPVDDMLELRAFLANRRAFAAATRVLKNGAIWIVAIAAAVVVAKNSFVEAVGAVLRVGK